MCLFKLGYIHLTVEGIKVAVTDYLLLYSLATVESFFSLFRDKEGGGVGNRIGVRATAQQDLSFSMSCSFFFNHLLNVTSISCLPHLLP